MHITQAPQAHSLTLTPHFPTPQDCLNSVLNVLVPQGGQPLEQMWDPERFEPNDDLSRLELEPYAHYLEVRGGVTYLHRQAPSASWTD